MRESGEPRFRRDSERNNASSCTELAALLEIGFKKMTGHATVAYLCWLYGISVPKMDVFAFHFCGFSKLWHAPVKGCKSISCVSIHDAEVDAVHPHFQ